VNQLLYTHTVPTYQHPEKFVEDSIKSVSHNNDLGFTEAETPERPTIGTPYHQGSYGQ